MCSLTPRLAVEIAVADGLGEVLGLDGGRSVEVGDGAGQSEDSVVGAGTELQAVDDIAQHGHVLRCGGSVLAHQGGSHLCVAVDAGEGAIAFLLNLAGTDDALADGCRGFAGLGPTEVVEAEGRDFDLYVDAVQERSADLVQVFVNLSGRALTRLGGMVVVAAGTGVHRGDEHDVTGVLYAVLGASDGDVTVLQRLAQHFKGGALKFG